MGSPVVFRVAKAIGWHRDEFGWHRQGRIERIVGQTGSGRWWFAPEARGLPWVLEHAPLFDTEAKALTAAMAWATSGEPEQIAGERT